MQLRHSLVLFGLMISPAAFADDPSGTTLYPSNGATTPADDGMKPADMPTKPMEQLTDGQILGAVIALNDMEKRHASYVLGRTKNKDVQAFAQRMVDDHGALNDKLRSWGHDANVVPADSDTEDHMDAKKHDQHEKLEKLKGRELDREFIDMMVMGHQKALTKLDNLTDQAKDPALKAILTDARPKVEAHLAEAQRIQSLLGPQGGATMGKSNDVAPKP
jgi:putative membrane protein